MATLRAQIVDTLKLSLPRHWRFITSEGMPDRIDVPTVTVRQYEIEKLPQAPTGAYRYNFTVQLLSPVTDTAKAEDQLDELLPELLLALDDIPYVLWTTATKTLVNDLYFAYGLTLSVLTTKEP